MAALNAFVLAVVLWLPARVLRARLAKRRRAVASARFYRKLLGVLQRRGIVREAHVTPNEFAQTVTRHLPQAADPVGDDPHILPYPWGPGKRPLRWGFTH